MSQPTQAKNQQSGGGHILRENNHAQWEMSVSSGLRSSAHKLCPNDPAAATAYRKLVKKLIQDCAAYANMDEDYASDDGKIEEADEQLFDYVNEHIDATNFNVINPLTTKGHELYAVSFRGARALNLLRQEHNKKDNLAIESAKKELLTAYSERDQHGSLKLFSRKIQDLWHALLSTGAQVDESAEVSTFLTTFGASAHRYVNVTAVLLVQSDKKTFKGVFHQLTASEEVIESTRKKAQAPAHSDAVGLLARCERLERELKQTARQPAYSLVADARHRERPRRTPEQQAFFLACVNAGVCHNFNTKGCSRAPCSGVMRLPRKHLRKRMCRTDNMSSLFMS